MNTAQVDNLAKRILVAMQSNPNVNPEDYGKNATAALKAAQALNIVLVFGPDVDWNDAWPKQKGQPR